MKQHSCQELFCSRHEEPIVQALVAIKEGTLGFSSQKEKEFLTVLRSSSNRESIFLLYKESLVSLQQDRWINEQQVVATRGNALLCATRISPLLIPC